MDIFWILDPDPHNNRCGSATLPLISLNKIGQKAGYFGVQRFQVLFMPHAAELLCLFMVALNGSPKDLTWPHYSMRTAFQSLIGLSPASWRLFWFSPHVPPTHTYSQMQHRIALGQVRCRTGQIQYRSDAGQVRYRTRQMQDRTDAGQVTWRKCP